MLCVGLAFFLAGVAIIIQLLGHANDSGDLPAGAPLWLRGAQYLIGLCIFACFGAIIIWLCTAAFAAFGFRKLFDRTTPS